MMRITVELVTDMTTEEVEAEVSLLIQIGNMWDDIYDIDVEDMGVDL